VIGERKLGCIRLLESGMRPPAAGEGQHVLVQVDPETIESLLGHLGDGAAGAAAPIEDRHPRRGGQKFDRSCPQRRGTRVVVDDVEERDQGLGVGVGGSVGG
jgi:hypothetical protein